MFEIKDKNKVMFTEVNLVAWPINRYMHIWQTPAKEVTREVRSSDEVV